MNQALVSSVLGSLILAALALPGVRAAVVQSNLGTGDGTIPGGSFVTSGNLLATDLDAVSRSGTFYREDSGYAVELSRLSDGVLGPLGSTGLGGDGAYTVMPGVATIQFDLAGAFDLTAIRTYASWDDGRSGQGYVVKYATSVDPLTFNTLHTVTNWNNHISIFPTREETDWDTFETYEVPVTDTSTTLTTLTSDSGFLAEDVVSLQFVFSGYQNNGTAFREFQVEGSSAVSAVPEPSGMLGLAGLIAGSAFLRRRIPAREQREMYRWPAR